MNKIKDVLAAQDEEYLWINESTQRCETCHHLITFHACTNSISNIFQCQVGNCHCTIRSLTPKDIPTPQPEETVL